MIKNLNFLFFIKFEQLTTFLRIFNESSIDIGKATKTSEWIFIDFGKFKVWMDVMSEVYLAGTIISWKVEGLNEGFEFVNPQEQSACGCGVSVSF